jgi:hypothetical protein
MTPCAIAPEILTVFRQEHKAFFLTMKVIKAIDWKKRKGLVLVIEGA